VDADVCRMYCLSCVCDASAMLHVNFVWGRQNWKRLIRSIVGARFQYHVHALTEIANKVSCFSCSN
jgi:hypothetical protein